MEEWIFRRCVIVLPFDEMISDIKTSVVVGTIFKVDNNQLGLPRILPKKDITLLHIVMTKYDWIFFFFNKVSKMERLKNITKRLKRTYLQEFLNSYT